MKKKELKQLTIKDITSVKAEEYNTNNAWGFGGIYGVKYTFPSGAAIVKGTACYRHMPPHPWVMVWSVDERRIEFKSLTAKNIQEAYQMIK